MYCNILTHKEHPRYRAVKKMAKLLLEFVEADCIYFTESDLESKIGIMSLVISRESEHYYDDVNDHLWKVIQNHTEFVFCFFNRDCIKDELKRGNLFFILNCGETDLIYINDGQKPVMDIKSIKLKRLIKQTKKRYQIWRSEAVTIGRDFKYHHNNDNLLMAFYVLHQQFRYMFINVSWLLTGEWIPHEGIADQQEHVGAFKSSFGNVFDVNIEKEKDALEKMESARKAVQWGEHAEPFDIESADYANEKLQWMKKEVETVFLEKIEKAKEIFNNHGNR
jgi:hypothetical protein